MAARSPGLLRPGVFLLLGVPRRPSPSGETGQPPAEAGDDGPGDDDLPAVRGASSGGALRPPVGRRPPGRRAVREVHEGREV